MPADSAESVERQATKAGGEIRLQLAGLMPEIHISLDKAMKEPQPAAMRRRRPRSICIARRTAAVWPALPIHVPGDVQSVREEPAEILSALDSQSLLAWHAGGRWTVSGGPGNRPTSIWPPADSSTRPGSTPTGWSL